MRAHRVMSWIRPQVVAACAMLCALGTASAAHAQEVIEYYGTDNLGSIRVVFNASGTIVSRADYLPFGEELAAPGPMPAERFTGQARDGEAGMDYFHARQYQPRSGRFNAVDPVFNAVGEPQKWNRYSYSLNSPLRFTDPSGLDPTDGYSCRQVTPNMGSGCVYMPNSAVIVPQGIHGEGSQIGTMSEGMAQAYQEYGNNQTAMFWTGVIDGYAPPGKPYETETDAVTDINPIMVTAGAVTGWEWGRNIFFDTPTESFRTGNAFTSMERARIDSTDILYNVIDDRGGGTWVGVYHTHTNGNARPSRQGTSASGGPGDIGFANQWGVAIFSGASSTIYGYYPPAWTGGAGRVVQISR